ncbi:hypothetical protein GLAREA_11326 [Glarea lozoyensis ATCC 20868]|uniref:Heterokaryon incompatibility domain-containing protein n=1 Tax=Glarea lozoyensis (strain ATCC 20868 / MF5171) TaxID=1116229 RepID=S3DUI8_GLAL2|nr:uncharacterized protein GLAREA_11326 [Glarea lozoyensis ATCC 20868]EPE35626.1 hypothetical protein GLAREA_11326 [Glarea lozoyensis ATCC 20868]
MSVDVSPNLCPNLKARVSLDLGKAGLFYWTQLGGTQTSKSHTSCTDAACYANDTHAAVCHIRSGCSCPLLGPQILDVMRILKEGLFALIAIDNEGDQAKVVVRPYKPGVSFTLISHALGDCLANRAENTLPTCQLKNIRHILCNIHKPEFQSEERNWFWLDTLCIPLSHLGTSITRHSLTKSMKSIAKAAHKTLVLDSDISLLRSSSKPEEMFLRIAYSSWNSRLWTLQEAVFANKLILHLSDQDIELESLKEMCRDSLLNTDTKYPWDVKFPFLILRQYLDSFHANLVRSVSHDIFLREAIEGRTTTEKADKRLVIANLLDIEETELDTCVELVKLLTAQETHIGCHISVLEDPAASNVS